MHVVRRPLAVASAIVVGCALLVSGGPAAASGNPPVTQPDAVTVTAGGRAVPVDYVGNDSDPEGDKLIMCGTQVDTPRGTWIYAGKHPEIATNQRARPGVYSIRVSICDGTSSAYSTLTLTILPSPADLLVIKKTGRPGKLRVVNENAGRVQFLWGANDSDRKDGSVRIRKGRSEVITAHRHSLVWLVRTRQESGLGITRGIRLPAHETPLPLGAPRDIRLAEVDAAWMTRDP